MNGYIEPTNYSMARKLAANVFGFVLKKDNDWGEFKVYPKGLDRIKLAKGEGVYYTSDWEDAWCTMKSMWRADQNIQKRGEA